MVPKGSSALTQVKTRQGLTALALILLLPSAAQAQQGGRAYGLCDLPDDLSARQIARIQDRADFGQLLDYAAEYCPEVGLLLTEGATASLPPDPTAPAATGGEDGARAYGLCSLPGDLSTRQIIQIQARPDFGELLTYAAEFCPEVALLLTDTPTATAPTGPAFGGGNGEGGAVSGSTGNNGEGGSGSESGSGGSGSSGGSGGGSESGSGGSGEGGGSGGGSGSGSGGSGEGGGSGGGSESGSGGSGRIQRHRSAIRRNRAAPGSG